MNIAKSIRASILTIWCTACMPLASGQAVDPGPDFDRITTEIPTPSVDWARSLPGDPIEAILIAGRLNAREAVELAQRMPIRFQPILLERVDHVSNEAWTLPFVGGRRDYEDLIHRAMETIEQDADVLVLACDSFEWQWLPPELGHAILQKVSDGTGLLITGTADSWPDLLNQNDPAWTEVTELSTGSFPEAVKRSEGKRGGVRVFTRKIGKGRAVGLLLPGTTANVVTSGSVTAAEYEHALQMGIRWLLTAADRELSPSWDSIEVEGRQPVMLRAKMEEEHAGATVLIEIADAWNEVREGLEPIRLGPGENILEVPLPDLPAGDYWCRVFVDDVDSPPQRMNFASIPFRVNSDVRIQNIAAEQQIHESGSSGRFRIDFSKATQGRLVARIFDTDNRLLAETMHEMAAEAETYELDLPIPSTHAVVHHLEIDLVRDEKVTARDRLTFGVQQRLDEKDFHIGYWGSKGGPYWPDFLRQRALYEHGFDYGLFANRPDGHVLILDSTTFLPRIIWNVPETAVWPNDPEFREKIREGMESRLEQTLEWSPIAMSFGDEPSYRFTDRTEPAMRDFQTAMREKYGTLDALNKAWDSNYETWEEVERVEIRQALSRFNGNPAAGFASAWFNRKLTGDVYAYQQKILDELRPGLRGGPEGVFEAPEYFSIDFMRLLREQGFLGSYLQKTMLGPVRSFGRDDLLYLVWFGGYGATTFGRPERMANTVWASLLEGANSVAWFADYPGPRGGRWIAPFYNADWKLNEVGRPVFEEIDRAKRGIGRLLLTSQRQDDGIYLFYPTQEPFRKTFARWAYLIESLGYQIEYLTAEQIEGGALEDGKCRLLVLSEAYSISDATRDRVTQFVRDGGNLLIDRYTGVFDEHGTPRSGDIGAFDALCGIERRISPRKTPLSGRIPPHEGDVLEAGDSSLSVDVKLPRDHPDRPTVIAREVGRGRAVYLNLGLQGSNEMLLPQRSIVENVFEWFGMKPQLEITTDQPHTLGLMAVRYDRGPAEMIAINRQLYDAFAIRPIYLDSDDSASWSIALDFEDDAHQFDAYEGTYLDFGRRFEGILPLRRPLLLTRLPFRPVEIQTTPSESTTQQGETIRIQAAVVDEKGSPLREFQSVAHVRFLGPDGREHKPFSRNIDVVDGQAEVVWDVALNETPGRWTLSFRDAATGVEGQQTILIE